MIPLSFCPARTRAVSYTHLIDLHVFVVPEPVELGAVYIIMGIKIILGNTPLLHGLPQTVVLYHFCPPSYLTFLYYPSKITVGTVFV